MKEHVLKTLIPEEEVEKRIRELAEEINRDYAGTPLHLVGILKGSVPFLWSLARNLTMPVTLWLLYRAMPDSPGFAFGLAASALWPGMIAGKLINLTGPAQWCLVLVSFGFGLWAILRAVRTIPQAVNFGGNKT